MNKGNKKKVVIIILNYINYKETEQCVKSILKQNYNNYHILIVDNGSNNASYYYFQKEYGNNKKVSVIKTGKNYGFAKGNNIGIYYAQNRLNAEYVMLLNSDTVINDCEYISKMVESDSAGVGVIGSKIIEPDNKIITNMYRYITFPATVFYYLKLFAEYRDHPLYQIFGEQRLKNYEGTYILKGCVLLLTPAYFRHYKGLDPRTFLYCEEELLYLRCKKAGLKEKLNDNVYLYHKGGQSTKILYRNKRKNSLKYMLASYKFVLLESIHMLLYGLHSEKIKENVF